MNIYLTQNFEIKYSIIGLISLIAVFFAVYTIISKNPIISVLFLIGLFCSIALYLMVIGLYFIGLSYLIIYVGAVSILFLFILMLINIRVSELLTDNRNSIILATLIIIFFNYSLDNKLSYSLSLSEPFNRLLLALTDLENKLLLSTDISVSDTVVSLFNSDSSSKIGHIFDTSWESTIITVNHIAGIGNILYTNLFVLFIIASLILLLAMIGAIVITINKSNNPVKPYPLTNKST